MDTKSVHKDRSHLELVTVYEICRILGGSLDIQRRFRSALLVLSTYLDLPRLMLVIPDEEGALRVHSAIGLTDDNVARGRWTAGEGVIGHVFESRMPVVVTNVNDAPEFIDRTGAFGHREGERLALIAVPMKSEHETVGVLAAQRSVEGLSRLSDDQRVLTMAGTLFAQAYCMHRSVVEERERLMRESAYLQKELTKENKRGYTLDNVVGQSAAMQQVFAEVHQAAPSKATVLLRGESGTGKEAIARAIHFLSPRKDAPFIKVNCAALSETLLESELFGHDKGAFTGATSDRKGRFELAHGGTLFLDEVGDISPGFQAKLLRVLQEREFERVGGTRSIKVDVRLICATNRNLEKMVQRGEYRADLYYRINVVSIFLPPLRERRDDIPLLVQHVIERFNKENHRQLVVSNEAMELLVSCYWPGNVRELENCLERSATMAQGNVLRNTAFLCHHNHCLTSQLHGLEKDDAVTAAVALPFPKRAPAADADGVTHVGPTDRLDAAAPARQFNNEPPQGERERLIWALEQCGWVQAKAARLLKVTPRQLGYALQRHHIEVRKL